MIPCTESFTSFKRAPWCSPPVRKGLHFWHWDFGAVWRLVCCAGRDTCLQDAPTTPDPAKPGT
jgi:hypothetical protein